MIFTERVYVRALPGGGFVAIDVTSSRPLLGLPSCHGSVLLERREHPRDGEYPLIVAEGAGATMSEVLRQLMPTASSNSAVASALLTRTQKVPHGSSRELAPVDVRSS
jgi:hypothetical protein